MLKENKEKFEKIYTELMDINQESVKNSNDEDAKSLSCYFLEVMDRKLTDYGIE